MFDTMSAMVDMVSQPLKAAGQVEALFIKADCFVTLQKEVKKIEHGNGKSMLIPWNGKNITVITNCPKVQEHLKSKGAENDGMDLAKATMLLAGHYKKDSMVLVPGSHRTAHCC